MWSRIALGGLLVASTVVLTLWWAEEHTVLRLPPAQQMETDITGGEDRVALITNLQPGESQESMIRRHLSLYTEWRRLALEEAGYAGDAVHEVDDLGGAAGGDASGGDH